MTHDELRSGIGILVTPEEQLHQTVERQSAEIAALRAALNAVIDELAEAANLAYRARHRAPEKSVDDDPYYASPEWEEWACDYQSWQDAMNERLDEIKKSIPTS